jgi:RNA polymerase sigma factor (sigma-70 family)
MREKGSSGQPFVILQTLIELPTKGYTMTAIYENANADDVNLVPSLSDRDFFTTYLANQALLRRCFNNISFSMFPSRSVQEKEDRWSDLLLRLKERKTFENYKPELGTYESYIFWQVKSIVNHMYTKALRHGKVIMNPTAVEDGAFDKAIDKLSYNHTRASSDKELRQELESILSENELSVLRTMVDEDLTGEETAERLGTHGMFISRQLKRIREKMTRYVAVNGIA